MISSNEFEHLLVLPRAQGRLSFFIWQFVTSGALSILTLISRIAFVGHAQLEPVLTRTSSRPRVASSWCRSSLTCVFVFQGAGQDEVYNVSVRPLVSKLFEGLAFFT